MYQWKETKKKEKLQKLRNSLLNILQGESIVNISIYPPSS